MDGGRCARVDLVDQRIEAASGPSRRPIPCRRRCGVPRAVGASVTSSLRITLWRYLRHSSMNSARRFF